MFVMPRLLVRHRVFSVLRLLPRMFVRLVVVSLWAGESQRLGWEGDFGSTKQASSRHALQVPCSDEDQTDGDGEQTGVREAEVL